MIGKSALVVAGIIVVIAITIGLYASGLNDQTSRGAGGGGMNSNMIEAAIKSDGGWSANIKDSESRSHLVDGFGDRTIPITCSNDGTYSIIVQKSDGTSDTLNVEIVKDRMDGSSSSSQRSSTTSANGIIALSGTC